MDILGFEKRLSCRRRSRSEQEIMRRLERVRKQKEFQKRCPPPYTVKQLEEDCTKEQYMEWLAYRRRIRPRVKDLPAWIFDSGNPESKLPLSSIQVSSTRSTPVDKDPLSEMLWKDFEYHRQLKRKFQENRRRPDRNVIEGLPADPVDAPASGLEDVGSGGKSGVEGLPSDPVDVPAAAGLDGVGPGVKSGVEGLPSVRVAVPAAGPEGKSGVEYLPSDLVDEDKSLVQEKIGMGKAKEMLPDEKKKRKMQVQLAGHHSKKKKTDLEMNRMKRELNTVKRMMGFYMAKVAKAEKKLSRMLKTMEHETC